MKREYNKWLSVGTGIGIRIRGNDLEVAVARVRPNLSRIVTSFTITGFRTRPAADWGAEYHKALASTGAAHLAATVLLPRPEVIVRHLSLPGVKGKDLASAVALQVDSLHPYAEDDAVHGWARLAGTSQVLVALARRQVVDQYALLFAEAGIRIASLTCSAAVIHSGLRFHNISPAEGFLILVESADGLEAYGESPARPFFSAAFDISPEQATALAASELRMDSGLEPRSLEELLPAGVMSTGDGVSALARATALSAACPWLTLQANLLPEEQRFTSSRKVYIPTIVLSAILLVMLGAYGVYGSILDSRYQDALEAEIARLTPQASQVHEIEQTEAAVVARQTDLANFRGSVQRDLDALQELTRILEPPIWVRSLRIGKDVVQINGIAPQAAPMLETIDRSPLFRGSEFTSPLGTGPEGERFNVRSQREAGAVPPPATPAAPESQTTPEDPAGATP